MYNISILNLHNKQISYNGYPKLLLTILQENNIEWMHACGGKGRCTTCRFEIIEGDINLAPFSDLECKVKNLGKLAPGERLACQAILQGDIRIKVPQLYKLPFVNYSE